LQKSHPPAMNPVAGFEPEMEAQAIDGRHRRFVGGLASSAKRDSRLAPKISRCSRTPGPLALRPYGEFSLGPCLTSPAVYSRSPRSAASSSPWSRRTKPVRNLLSRSSCGRPLAANLRQPQRSAIPRSDLGTE
jgi:hypothetical protein